MILYGASGHAKVIIDILRSQGIRPEYIVDDDPGINTLLDFEVRRNTSNYGEAIISIGNNSIRKKVTEAVRVEKYLKAIDASAIISPYARIGEGSVVMQGAIVQSCTLIGKHCILNTGATIDHDCNIGDFVHISPNATLCGNVEVGEGSWIGAGSVVKQGVKIGKWSVVGAGSVVVDDIPDNVVAFGNKCRIIKQG